MALHVPMTEVRSWKPRIKPIENGQETVVMVLPPVGTPLVAMPALAA